ncbi:MAG: Tab2/Atab2 family RNA-binding protein [Roseofilum sp. SBFL]|uniref:Tab2/Atab2 family RNA-binding protein n=1 Tax=unclassified Roseofilum TaxID=2620099 RepID=UPI001B227FE2|nr:MULTISPECIES: Tab2/Atab2 family RNA-binding protein [unclassified Roseofilum]MBP0014793.1 Tab2/Atab2 family RNA-binding protein [Roseofilum sp. SID3]MBP0024154.1 Tab2/Atab2 family RNA-binding protein [Roseofilum sp. SID2]MBP0038044.1 Tab2/Atab2 family RNA-binding protein [Roseofilum sp. SID1]MBP0042649.1 Tab2/Atab2 family RNA-binding protein [Roseofilum sp. SBFL]
MKTIWELDFYSRPILDENNKKIWEILICETPLSIATDPENLFRYSRSCSSSKVNSGELKAALLEAMEQAPSRPSKIRFFRRQMNNMIVKACKDLAIPSAPSRRTLTLYQWIQQRETEVYPQEAGYDAKAASSPSVKYESAIAQSLPDAILGQKWALVSLEAQAFAEMPEWEIAFGESFPLSPFELSETTPIPGIILFSSRAIPMAGWMSGLELAFLKVMENREDRSKKPRLLLETGVNESWILANLNTPQLLKEGENLEQAKKQSKGIHFIAIQSNPESESFAGFWLLQER